MTTPIFWYAIASSKNFLSHLTVRRVRNSLVIEVNFVSRDPVKAARIANTIVDVYIERQYKEKRRANEIAISLIDSKLEGLRERLATSEREIAKFRSANSIFDSKGHGLQDHQLSSELEKLIAARNQTTQARSRYQQAKRLAASNASLEAIPEAVQNQTVRTLRNELTTALRRVAELSTRYGPLHPTMLAAKADMTKARTELRHEIHKVIQTLKVEYDVATDRERQLEARFRELKSAVNVSSGDRWKLHQLQREVKANHQLYEAMLSRKKQAQETLGMQFPDAKLVANAEVPLIPSHPKRKKLVMLSFFAALGLSMAIAILLDQIAGGITNPDRIEREFGLPHIASVPRLQRREDGMTSPLAALRLMLTKPNGLYAESIREIRYELELASRSPGPPHRPHHVRPLRRRKKPHRLQPGTPSCPTRPPHPPDRRRHAQADID